MRITWLGHASFLIQGEGKRIVTDPYRPSITNLKPIEEKTDIVLRSSGDDKAHCFVDTLPKGYHLLTATDFVDEGTSPQRIEGIDFHFMPSRESVIHKELARENAFYRFTLENIRISHMGDVGNPLNKKQLEFLEGTDILFALTGGPPTIELDDLQKVIEFVQPRLIIPMHFRIPGPKFSMLPIENFTSYFPADAVEKPGKATVEFTRDSLPARQRVIVLEPKLVREEFIP